MALESRSAKLSIPSGRNHKDWRVDQQVALLQCSNEYAGVTLDTGNNLSILDNPEETVEKLAPLPAYATAHLSLS